MNPERCSHVAPDPGVESLHRACAFEGAVRRGETTMRQRAATAVLGAPAPEPEPEPDEAE